MRSPSGDDVKGDDLGHAQGHLPAIPNARVVLWGEIPYGNDVAE